jgi:hypothetical protein
MIHQPFSKEYRTGRYLPTGGGGWERGERGGGRFSPVHLLVLCQDQVIAGESHAEDDGGDALEAVDPLLPLRPLAAHVKHPAQQKCVT